MTRYHAVLLDETGCEFGAGTEAPNRIEAFDQIAENYPECSIVQLESPRDTAAREDRMWAQARREDEGDFSWGDY